MPYKTATVSNGLELFDALVNDLTNPSFMGADVWIKRWEHNLFGVTAFAPFSRRKACVFEAPGKSAEKVFLSLSIIDPATTGLVNTSLYYTQSMVNYDNAGLASGTWRGAWSNAGVSYLVGDIVTTQADATGGFVCVAAHTSSASNGPTSGFGLFRSLGVSSGGGIVTGLLSCPVYAKSSNGADSNLTYFLIANAQRMAVVIRSGTTDRRYHPFIMGMLERFGPMSINPYPVVVTGNGNATSFTDLADGSFIEDTLGGSSISPLATYDFELNAVTSANDIFAMYGPSAFGLDNTVVLDPIYIVLNSSSNSSRRGLLGHLDGVRTLRPIPSMQSEDTVTIGADSWWVFNNVDQGTGGNFLALKRS